MVVVVVVVAAIVAVVVVISRRPSLSGYHGFTPLVVIQYYTFCTVNVKIVG